MGWPQKLVFLNGTLKREGADYIWINRRLLFKGITLSNADEVSVIHLTGHQTDYGKDSKDIKDILDPAQKLRD